MMAGPRLTEGVKAEIQVGGWGIRIAPWLDWSGSLRDESV